MSAQSEVTIRPFRSADEVNCERVIRNAFWNMYRPGCHEHYVWHLAHQGHPDLVRELSFIAEADSELVGCVMSTVAHVVGTAGGTPVLAVGPLGVHPAQQGRGIGSRLMECTLAAARDMFPGAFLYGDPAYYPRFGFGDAARWGVTTAEGDNFAEFMAIELRPGSLQGLSGRLVESGLFEIDQAEVDAFDRQFPYREKATHRPG